MDVSTRHPRPTISLPPMKSQPSSTIVPVKENARKPCPIGVNNPSVLKIEICPDGDFLIQLIPEKPTLSVKTATSSNSTQSGLNSKRPRLVQFRVSKNLLQKTSSYFQQLFKARPDLPNVVFENRGIGFGYTLEIWLRAIHHGIESLPSNLKATHTERAWVAIGVGEQFGFAPHCLHILKPWFVEGYEHALNTGAGLTPMAACSLAFPCSVFDHAEGFMKLTKYLAYHTNGNIFSHNPSQFQHLNSDARILDGPLTNARAHIQSVLDRELFFPLKKLHAASCECRKETAFDYQATLMTLDCWPVDKAVAKYPLHDIIDELEKFDFTPKAHDSCTSGVCSHNFKNSVQIATSKAKATFDGLCLDCMERSQAEELPRGEYMSKNAPYKGCFDMGCRFGHGRTSWYFSWMGSLAVRRDILNQIRLERPLEKGRGHRGKRGGKRLATRDNIGKNKAQGSESHGEVAHGSDRDIGLQEGDDDDEFFDAEDDYHHAGHGFDNEHVA